MQPLLAAIIGTFLLVASIVHGASSDGASPVAASISRQVLIVFGADPAQTGRRQLWAPDTLTALHLQSAMEWMGLQAQFHEIQRPLPDAKTMPESYAGVIIDGSLSIAANSEDRFVDWLSALIAQHTPVLFFGDLPVDETQPRKRLFALLGLQGSGLNISEIKDLRLTLSATPITKGEMPITATARGMMDLQAPAAATPLVTVAGKDATDAEHSFDAAFLAPWGGMVFSPYLFRQFSDTQIRQLIDPFALIQAALRPPVFPVPDATTRDGQRMLFSHIDGDGFTSVSKIAVDSLCGEIIRDRVLSRYDMPITVSLIEAEVRGLGLSQEAPNVSRYEKAARSIFALPNVQVASHTYTHPFIWIAGDDDEMPLNRKARFMDLKPEVSYPKLDPEREIKGSVQYINETLAPKDKPAELLLWSGNCRPGPEMLAQVRALGLEQMNGGNTIISKRWPGRSGIAPQFTQMGDELQVYAPNQNEMYYTDNWQARFLGGYAKVIETFTMTEQPRRVKPVNIYYHFYSGERGDALAALLKVYDWALAQPLHAVTALDYVKTVRDARDTRIELLSPTSWCIRNAGHCRSLRLPISAGYPEVGGTTNVSGWADVGDQRYLSLSASPAILTLHAEPPTAPSLQSSSVDLRCELHDAQHLRLASLSSRSGEVSFRLPAGGKNWHVTVNGNEVEAKHQNGIITLTVIAKGIVEATGK
jgi:hypothetical protein